MNPQEMLLQALVTAGQQGAAFEPTENMQVGGNYAEAFNTVNASPLVGPEAMYSLDSAQPVTDPAILQLLASGITQIAQNGNGQVMERSNADMDGAIQEKRTLTALKHSAGIERVNAHTGQTGIIARPDADGRVVLTNLTPTGKVIEKQQEGYDIDGNSIKFGQTASTPGQVKTNNNIQGIIDLMRKTTDGATLRGLRSQLNESMAAEEARLYTTAQEQASIKLGIPDMEKQLASMQALERTLPGWRPDMPETPQTLAVRTRIEQTRGLVDAEAKRYLAGNVTAASLQAAAKNAEAEVTRITKIEDAAARAAELEANRDANAEQQRGFIKAQSEAAREARREAEREELAREASALTNQQRDTVKVLFPEKASADDVEILKTIKLQSKDKEFMAIISAEEDKLPLLAASGNSRAAVLVRKKEADLGIDPKITENRLNELNKLMSNDKLATQFIEQQTAGNKEAKASALSMLAKGRTSLATPEEKQAYLQTRYQAAMAQLNKGTEATFRNNLVGWAVPDEEFQAALKKAKEITGQADMKEVLATYIGNASGPERSARIAKFKKFATDSAKATQGSRLGAVSTPQLAIDIDALAAQRIIEDIGRGMPTRLWDAGRSAFYDITN